MKFDRIVKPSDQVDIIVPEWIREQFPRFVEFMTTAFQAEERQGFAADILQNMLKYRDFDYYKGEVIFINELSRELTEEETEEIYLNNPEGFPKENGVIQIDNEIILYRSIEDNKLVDLQRGASGTIYLGTFVRDSDYIYTNAKAHITGTTVVNLSALFLRSFLKTIHETFVTGIDPDWVDEGINRGTLLERIRDFFQSKGTKLGIQSLFKILFGENDVDVHYPGDRMIVPSKSTFNETNILRTVPIPEILVNLNTYIPPERLLGSGAAFRSQETIEEERGFANEAIRADTILDTRNKMIVRSTTAPKEVAIVSPEKLINKEIVLKNYVDLQDEATADRIYGRAICDYVTTYQYGDETQYEMYVQKKTVEGNFVSNPTTFLTRQLNTVGDTDDRSDYSTITVQSTIGFADKGIIFINNEGIRYNGITFNQFLNCTRGFIGVEDTHYEGTAVYGPYFIEGTYTVQDERGRPIIYTSRSWPKALVEKVNIVDPGVLHEDSDRVVAGAPGNSDPREPMLTHLSENFTSYLVQQNGYEPNMMYVEDRTASISGVYFDDQYVFVTSTNFPNHPIGAFSDDDSVGPIINLPNALHVFPRNNNIRENYVQLEDGETAPIFSHKGFGPIGMCTNGAPFYSNVSNQRILSGTITKYEILHPGFGYVNPTLLVEGREVNETVTLGQFGEVTHITTNDSRIYDDIVNSPTVELTCGRNAVLSVAEINSQTGERLNIDEYGRILSVTIIDGGEYYSTPPSVTINDRSKKGKGAALEAIVEDGKIIDVKVINSGIDYNRAQSGWEIYYNEIDVTSIPSGYELPAKANEGDYFYNKGTNTVYVYYNSPIEVVVTPRGQGAQIAAAVQYYQLNRYGEIQFSDHWFFDVGGGFLWEFRSPSYHLTRQDWLGDPGQKINYGYITHPLIQDEGFTWMEPGLIGYAYDGCPIYSPILWVNGKDGSEGYRYAFSGYVQRPNRENVIPGGGGAPVAPPRTEDYPMGTFVEDYVFDADAVAEYVQNLDPSILPSPPSVPEDFESEFSLPLPGYSGKYAVILNSNNAVLMNTPEYPVELYPDGVWCYIATMDYEEQKPSFPYVMGQTFQKRPLTQKVQTVLRDEPQAIPFMVYNPEAILKETPIIFDFDLVERQNNPYLPDTNDAIRLEIENCSRGSVSGVEVVDGLPFNSKVGDFVYFDNENSGGSGASGIVTEVTGIPVVSGRSVKIATQYQSHFQKLNVGTSVYDDVLHDHPLLEEGERWEHYHFIEGQIITTTSKAEARVVYWDWERSFLYVDTFTKNLILPGDAFRDIKDRWVKLAPGILAAPTRNYWTLNNDALVRDSNVTGFSEEEPIGSQPGDLWFSSNTGRLYVFFNDGDSAQWVAAQPITMRPVTGALDIGTGTAAAVSGTEFQQQDDVKVIISEASPTERLDGSILRTNDLWWSPHTGFMYIFIQGQWICTDPNAIVPKPSAADDEMDWGSDILAPIYENGQHVLISDTAPVDSGDNLYPGLLWWCPSNGKMFIYYLDPDNAPQWVQTNPVGRPVSSTGLDGTIDGGGGGDSSKPPVEGLPLPDGNGDDPLNAYFSGDVINLWFDHLRNFAPGDQLAFQSGGPDNFEIMTLEKILVTGSPAAAKMRRGSVKKTISNRALVWNANKYEYLITTEAPHKVRLEDKITIVDSAYSFLNQTHELVEVGVVKTAEGTTTINAEGEVTGATVTVPGEGYTADFEVYFYGGNGFQGTGIAKVNPDEGGFVESIEVTNPGYSYVSPPNIWFGDVLQDNEMMFYTTVEYPEETQISYKTDSPVLEGGVATVEMLSGGQGYVRMPKILGIYKKFIDRGSFKVKMDFQSGVDGEGLPIYSQGTSIKSVEIIDNLRGDRYKDPLCLFIDLAGSGYGATAKAKITDGKVDEIKVLSGGTDYIEPILLLIEDSGKYIGLTETIGQIKDIAIINPGRSLSTNETINPEIQIDTRCIVEFDTYVRASLLSPDGYVPTAVLAVNGNNNAIIDPNRPINEFDNFNKGDFVWQGTEDGTHKLATATVIDYDGERQIITLRDVVGELKDGEYLYGENGEKGKILKEGQADVRLDAKGMSRPKGKFIDDTSILSSKFANIQDSYYYQHFSYSISSPIQQQQFDDFVTNIIHPAGMVMFSDVQVRSNVQNAVSVFEPLVAGPVLPILSPDGYNIQYTAFTPMGEFENNPAIGPNMGTVEKTDNVVVRPSRRKRDRDRGSNKVIIGDETATTTSNAPVEFKEEGPFAINGYYPLYNTRQGANDAGDGTSHSHTLDYVKYYMPNGVDIYHGNYPG